MLVFNSSYDYQVGRPGVFATRYIKEKSLVWTYSTSEMYDRLFEEYKEVYEKFGWWDIVKCKYIIPHDLGMFIRCAESKDEANLEMDKESGHMFTARVIDPGEELLEWYPDYMNNEDLERYGLIKPNLYRLTKQGKFQRAAEKFPGFISDPQEVPVSLLRREEIY